MTRDQLFEKLYYEYNHAGDGRFYEGLKKSFDKVIVPYLREILIDEDEQEFEVWWAKEDGDGARSMKSDCRTAWMAARGKK